MLQIKVAICGLSLLMFLATGCGGSNPSSSTVSTSTTTPTSTPSTKNEWTWISGSTIANQAGSYGQQGIAASTNAPSCRDGAASWTDPSGNLWLYGGSAGPPSNNPPLLSDLWKFNNGQWTWVNGSNVTNQSPVYGSLGVPAPANNPGGRSNAATWVDSSGSFWLFGGVGVIANQRAGDFNDLWRYNNGQWTWMGGPQTTQSLVNKGSYGNKGVASANNIPSGRDSAVTWTDSSGNLWLFGGDGSDSVGYGGLLNDLWKYSNGQWTWVSGSNLSGQFSVYGVLGVTAPSNVPSGRAGGIGWLDSSGNLWLFGGLIVSSGPFVDMSNDLWKFSNGQWTWMGGSNQPNQQGIFGTQGTPSATNAPGARSYAASWVDSLGNFWLFSGYSATVSNQSNEPTDLWKYSGGQWTWIGGGQGILPGAYGTVGVASPANLPGSRMRSATWIDGSGRLWVFGGEGYGASLPYGYLNDMWMYQP